MATSVELPPDVHGPLARFLGDHLELPMLPEAAARVIALCQDADSDQSDIQAALERDPSLASHVLRIANSAMFAPVEPIASLKQAVSRLGMTTIRNLALAVSLRGRVFCSKQHEDLTRQMWRHSAVAAVFARDIARRLRRNTEMAFLCGLMHDVGRPIVLQAAIEQPGLLTSGTGGGPLLEAAMDTFHAPVGARLVQAWGLPATIAVPVACHHDPDAAGPHAIDARVTRLADLLAHWAVEEDLDPEDFPQDEPVAEQLGLAKADVRALLGLRQQAIAFATGLG